jgi:hypothetical protein
LAHRIGKKIGTYTELFPRSTLDRYLMMGAIGDQFQGGSTNLTKSDLEEFGIKPEKDINTVMIQTKGDQFVIQFGQHTKTKPDPKSKLGGFINTKITFAVDLKTFDVYNSEY